MLAPDRATHDEQCYSERLNGDRKVCPASLEQKRALVARVRGEHSSESLLTHLARRPVGKRGERSRRNPGQDESADRYSATTTPPALALTSVMVFIADSCELDLTARTPRCELYPAYTKWCAANGRRPIASRNVYAKLLEHLPSLVERPHLGFAALLA